MTKQEATLRLNKNYVADIALFDKMEQQILMISDFLTAGLLKQHPPRDLYNIFNY